MVGERGGGEDMRAFWAKVVGRSDVEGLGGWLVGGGMGFGAGCEANGFVVGSWDVVEVEKGLWPKLLEERVELKRLLPRSCGGCVFFWSSLTVLYLSIAFNFCVEPFGIRIPLTALIVPSFLLQALLLQLNMYSFRSWPGNFSGRSPFNCSNRVIMLWHTLHLASSAEGASVSGGHI